MTRFRVNAVNFRLEEPAHWLDPTGEPVPVDDSGCSRLRRRTGSRLSVRTAIPPDEGGAEVARRWPATGKVAASPAVSPSSSPEKLP